jgi:hypothetical protein
VGNYEDIKELYRNTVVSIPSYLADDTFKDKAGRYHKYLSPWFTDVYIDKNGECFQIDDSYGLIKKKK